MKFSTAFSALLCAFSLGVTAAPTTSSEFSELERRAPAPATIEKGGYARMKGVHSPLVVGTTYVFTQKNPINPAEKDKKMIDLTKSLGFSHIYLVVGKVTSSSKTETKGKNKGQVTTTLDFVGTEYDMVMDPKDKTKVKANSRAWNYAYVTGKTIEYKGTTTRTEANVKSEGKFPFFTLLLDLE
jgi:hypothetical protein